MNIEITTRREMAETLDAVMNASYMGLVEELRLSRGHSLLKTYLIEAHSSASHDHSMLFESLKLFFGRADQGSRSFAVVSETFDDKLFRVRGHSKSQSFMFYIDAADPRFWWTHSLAKSEVSDLQIDALLRANRELDCAWMPTELLSKVQDLGQSRGLGLDFDRRYIDSPLRSGRKAPREAGEVEPQKTKVTKDEHFEYVKMQLWGSGASRILDALAKAGLSNSTTVSKVRLKTEAAQDAGLFSLTDVKYDGKVTGRGTSFAVYNGLLADIKARYAKAVLGTESRFKLEWKSSGATARLAGEPIYLRLGTGISDLDHFCAKLFSGDEPFRLLGRPIKRNPKLFTVSAVDLHVNQRIDFEVSRSTMTVFLPQKTCGNSILRLYTNLQHFLTSDVDAIDGSGARIFSFQP